MDVSSKSEQAEGRASLTYQDESDDVRSLLSDDGRDFATADASNSTANVKAQKKTLGVRLLAALGWSRPTERLPYYALQQRGRASHPKPRSRRCIGPCLRYFVVFLLGIIVLILAKWLLGERILPENPKFWPEWGQPGEPGDRLAHYPHDITRDILPVPCHSHNDFMRDIPLWDAIHSGCTSIEVNVFYIRGLTDLMIGGDDLNLTPRRTFPNLYIKPLFDLLRKRNPMKRKMKRTAAAEEQGVGVYEMDKEQTLALVINFQNHPNETFQTLKSNIKTLYDAGYLAYFDVEEDTYVDGAITVVATGNVPVDLIMESKEDRLIFYDAPLAEFSLKSPTSATSVYDRNNTFSASASMRKAVGFPWLGRYTGGQINTLRDQVAGAQKAGFKTRYSDFPGWPTSLRNYIWGLLVREGVDYLTVDDIQAATKGKWGTWG